MRRLGAFHRQSFVVKLPRLLRIEREIELVFPANLEARLADGVVALLRRGMSLGEVGRVRGDPVRDNPLADVVAIIGTMDVVFGEIDR